MSIRIFRIFRLRPVGGHAGGIKGTAAEQPAPKLTAADVRADTEHRTPPWSTEPDYRPGPAWLPGRGVLVDVGGLHGRTVGPASLPRLHRIPAPCAPTRIERITGPFPPPSPFTADYRELPQFRATLRTAGWCGLSFKAAQS